jgi:uncharacterized membrane protein
MEYLTLKWLHVLSATVLAGGGLGSAFHLVWSSWRREPAAAAAAAHNVLRSDALLAAPAGVFQVASGLWLMHQLKLPLSTPWIMWSLTLYGAAFACWIPVLWLEVRMRRVAREAASTGAALPRRYWTSFAWWALLGLAGFAAIGVIFWLMVVKRLPLA